MSARPVFHSLLGQTVFSVGEESYGWEDVVLAARCWGDWTELNAEVREGVACVRHMLETEQPPTPAEEDTAATEFRTTRRLLAAADMEAWLSARGLSADNWMRYIRRTLLRDRWAADLRELVATYPARADQVRRSLKTSGICSGRFMRFAAKLAGRATVYDSAIPVDAHPPDAADDIGMALLGLSLEDYQARLRRIIALEACFRHFGEPLLSPAAIQTQIATRYADWMQVEYRSAIFPNQESADEAVLCVREDGEALSEVARRCKLRPVHRRVFLDKLHPSMRALLLSGKKGELLGPLPAEGGFKLVHLLEKSPASIQDEATRRRAEEWIVASAASKEAEKCVRWHVQL